jgi:hypothetical protein
VASYEFLLESDVGGAVRPYLCAVGEQFSGVFEDDDAIAEQAPTLLWVADKSSGRLTVRC